MWEPATIEYIEKNIQWCNDVLYLNPLCLTFWNYIKIEPEKWNEKTMGELGGGFWVVGIIGKKVIYYNDIEEGFNLSEFTKYGEINSYECSQSELHELIISLFS